MIPRLSSLQLLGFVAGAVFTFFACYHSTARYAQRVPQFGSRRQQDALEMLKHLIDGVHEEERSRLKKLQEMLKKQRQQREQRERATLLERANGTSSQLALGSDSAADATFVDAAAPVAAERKADSNLPTTAAGSATDDEQPEPRTFIQDIFSGSNACSCLQRSSSA